ncbi:LacI family DNA-binding transcriptional regulator [Bradyrhizobium sp. CIAT3101]|uniref:LacI family DNA-binding transcriptional regulator n=1 Tax=Bradyrhizobium sp. CIAT3101 TaxID=439387 RepID=UPI0024B1617B|nr:LacI family DNA-binding transcriptional regulator [Bradyrhizobium sp. CIAT3101]WFU80726.1 LacI family DNA-binding transcriptional regulator [Bradyrhizobium sp. CIAT3101]
MMSEKITHVDQSRQSPTVVEIAKRAGCSIATVSRVLNRPQSVAHEMRERILRIVEEVGYVPNGSARALRSSRSRLIGLIVPTLDSAIFTRMLEGLESRLAPAGASLIYSATGYDLDREIREVRNLIEKGVDGIVLVGTTHRKETLKLLHERRVRFAVTYSLSNDHSIPSMGFDNRSGGALAANYLADLGHKHLAVIAGITRENERASGRLEGFLAAAERRGISRSSIVVVEAPYEFSRGRAAVKLILNQNRNVTAIFCGSDVLAVGALRGCRDAELSVPQDISMIGFDNLDIAEYLTPGLTTVDVPARLMGEQAANYFLADHNSLDIRSRVELETRLIVRESTAPARDRR